MAKFIFSGLLIYGVLTLTTGCFKPEIRVGYISDFQYRAAPIGIETYQAMTLYLSEHTNSRIKLFPISLTSNEDLLPAYLTLEKQGIHLIIVGSTSSSLAALLPYIDTNEDLIFNIMSASEDFTGKDDCILRNIPDTVLESRSIADFIADRFPGKRLLILFDTGNAVYCLSALKNLTNYFSTTYPSVNYTTLGVSYADTPPGALIGKLRGIRFEAVYLLSGGGTAIQAGSYAQAIREMNRGVKMITSPWINAQTFFKSGGESIDGAFIPSIVPALSDSDAYTNFIEDYNKKFGVLPSAVHSSFSYEIVGLIDQAINKGYITPASIKRYFLDNGPFSSQIGELSFDRYGDVDREYHFYRYEDGHLLNE